MYLSQSGGSPASEDIPRLRALSPAEQSFLEQALHAQKRGLPNEVALHREIHGRAHGLERFKRDPP